MLRYQPPHKDVLAIMLRYGNEKRDRPLNLLERSFRQETSLAALAGRFVGPSVLGQRVAPKTPLALACGCWARLGRRSPPRNSLQTSARVADPGRWGWVVGCLETSRCPHLNCPGLEQLNCVATRPYSTKATARGPDRRRS